MPTTAVDSSTIREPEFHPTDDSQLYGGMALTFLALFQGDNTEIHSTPIRLLYLITSAAPFIIMVTIYLRRSFFSAPPPVRWSPNSNVERRLKRLLISICGIGLSCLPYVIYAEHAYGRHDIRTTLITDLFWLLMGWIYMLSAYTAERKPLPPPRPPAASWEGMKPVHSEHWGQPTD